MQLTRSTLVVLLGLWTASVAQATTALWTNTANGTVDSWTTSANWNAATYPGAEGSYQNAFLTNRVSGSVYKAVISATLPSTLGTVEIKNSGGAGGEAWVVVTNATVTISNLLVRTQGRIEIGAQGIVTNAVVTNVTTTIDGTNGQVRVVNGGSLFATNTLNIGSTVGGTNNTLTIGDGGLVAAQGPLVVGNGSSYNTVYLAGSNATLRSGGSTAQYIGNASSCNRMVSTGSNAVWDMGGMSLRIGQQINTGSATNNALLVQGGSLTLTNQGVLNIGFGVGSGYDVSHNTLLVTNGASLFSKGSISVSGSGLPPNAAIVTGAGSFWDCAGANIASGGNGGTSNLVLVDQGATLSNCYINVGYTYAWAYGNLLVVTNDSHLYTTNLYNPSVIGYWGTNNAAVITGPGSFWNLGAQTLDVGYVNKSTNAFSTARIDNGATLTNGTFIVGNGAANGITIGNTLLVTGGAQLVGITAASTVGQFSPSNTMVVTGRSTFWDCNSKGVTIGNGASAIGNVLRIESGAVVTNGGSPTIGSSGGMSNMLAVTNGGQYWLAPGQSGFMGTSATNNTLWVGGGNATFGATGATAYCAFTIGNGNSLGNVMVVDNGGICPGWNVFYVGRTTNCLGNMLIVTNGGFLQAASVYANFRGTNMWSNTVVVVNGGVMESPSLVADSGGDITPLNGWNCIANNGGVYQFTTATPTITPVPSHNSLISINGGTIAFRALSTANIKGNWSGSQLTNMTWSGANAFRLNSATNATSPDQSYTFTTGLSATNYARLELFNGSLYRGGSVTIGNGGTLAFSGAASAITNLTIAAGGALEVTLNGTNSIGPLTALGSVTLGGALNLILTGAPAADWSATLINKTTAGAISGRFSNATLTTAYQGTNYAFRVDYAGGDGNDLVLRSMGPAAAGTVLFFR